MKKSIKVKANIKEESIKIKDKLSEALELPKELVLDLPVVSLIGKDDLTIENYKGIIEYTDCRVRINTQSGVLKIEGERLILIRITSESIIVKGKIGHIEFI